MFSLIYIVVCAQNASNVTVSIVYIVSVHVWCFSHMYGYRKSVVKYPEIEAVMCHINIRLLRTIMCWIDNGLVIISIVQIIGDHCDELDWKALSRGFNNKRQTDKRNTFDNVPKAD